MIPPIIIDMIGGFWPYLLIYIGITAAVCIAVFFIRRWLKKRPKFPYKSARLFTETEYAFYLVLKQCINEDELLSCKVRLGDVIVPTVNEIKYRNFVNQKHIDFLIADREGNPLLVIELDDRSHNRPDRVRRDEFVNNALKAAGLPILHVPVADEYPLEELMDEINAYID